MAQYAIKMNVPAEQLEAMCNAAYGKQFKATFFSKLPDDTFMVVFEQFSTATSAPAPRKQFDRGGYRGTPQGGGGAKGTQPISPKQNSRLIAIGYRAGLQPSDIRDYCIKNLGIDDTRDIQRGDYESVCRWAETGVPQVTQAPAPVGAAKEPNLLDGATEVDPDECPF